MILRLSRDRYTEFVLILIIFPKSDDRDVKRLYGGRDILTSSLAISAICLNI